MHIDDLERIIDSAKDDVLKYYTQNSEDNDSDLFLSFLEDVALKYVKRRSSFETLAKKDVVNEYQKLVHETINEYNITNERIHSINSESDIFLKESASKKDLIETVNITEQFKSFQAKIDEELEKANNTIKRLRKEIKTLEDTTNVDALTNVYNRRGLQNYLDPILEAAQEKQLDMWVLMLDIDDFKLINDSFGHVAGDKVLIFLSKLLKSIVREGDHVFRFGGEEFVVILNRITGEKAHQIANRILQTVRGNKLIYKADTISITLSIGLSQHEVGDNLEKMIERTDKLLYEAKSSGKNKIVTQGG